MASTYRLIMQSGTSMGTEYPLEKTELILGRDMGNDLVINDPEVSRRHLRLVLEGIAYRIEDLGSTNGTFIHGQRLSAPVILKPGDIITLGEKVVMRYEVSSPDPNATVVAQRGVNQGTQAAVLRPIAPPQAAPPAAPVPAAPIPSAPPPAQNYRPVPAAPAYPPGNMNMPGMAPAAPKKMSKGVLILIIIVGIVLLFCVIPAIIVDATNSYCSLTPGIMNMLFTGACP